MLRRAFSSAAAAGGGLVAFALLRGPASSESSTRSSGPSSSASSGPIDYSNYPLGPPPASANAPKSTSAPKSFTLPIIAKGQGNEVLMNPAILAITGGAIIVIPAVLFLAMRSARRSERLEDFVHAVELYVNKSPAVKQFVGPVFAAGKYDLALDDVSAKGFIAFQALGDVKAVALVDATRKSRRQKDWDFKSLKLEVDKYSLDQRTEKRREAALARYGKDALSAEDAAAMAKQTATSAAAAPAATAAATTAAAATAAAPKAASGAPSSSPGGGGGESGADGEGEVLTITLH